LLQGGLITIGGQTVTGVMFISSSIANITASDVGAAGGGAFVQLEGLNVTPGETLVFSVAATPVPLPSSLLLGLSAIAGFSFFNKRRGVAVSN
jgi:hypothetical protein